MSPAYNAQLDMLAAAEPLLVVAASAELAAAITTSEHYLKRRAPVAYAWALLMHGDPRGIVTFGTPASRQLQLSACRTRPDLVLELNRLWLDDLLPRNTESWFVAQALRALPARIVVSYADTGAGHTGYIYRALNFKYAGLTDADRKTPKFDYVLPSGHHPREVYRQGEHEPTQLERRTRSRKHRYWIVTGNRRERRALEGICTWPRLTWNKAT